MAPLQQTEIVTAVRDAYRLQSSYWDSLGGRGDPARRAPREAILAHYRRGFGDSLTAEYTEYALKGAPEKIMDVPDSVTILRISEDEADVAYPTPVPLREIWGRPSYTVDRLRKTGGQWRIMESRGSATKPTGVAPPA